MLDDPSVLRFALIRRPVERVVSAFWSKAACTGSDADRRIIVQSLAEDALADGVDDVTGLECLDGIEDLITMLEEARNGGRLGRIDEHLETQVTRNHGLFHQSVLPRVQAGKRVFEM